MNFVTTFIINQIAKSICSWQTTALSGWVAFLNTFLTNSGLIDPNYVHGLAGQIAQWSMSGISLILLAWQDRNQSLDDKTQPPTKDN